MTITKFCILTSALVALGALPGPANAAPFTLTPPPCEAACGASKLTQQSLRPLGTLILESQYAVVRVQASDLLLNSKEHLVVSLLATDQPFTPGGPWTPTASGGGLGIALGTISSQYHPACPPDPNDSKVEFAIERFGLGDPFASSLPQCVSFSKAALSTVTTLKLTVSADCTAKTCFVSAALRNADTNGIIATLPSAVVSRANTTRARKIWYAVTDFDLADPKRYSATFDVQDENYFFEGGSGPLQ